MSPVTTDRLSGQGAAPTGHGQSGWESVMGRSGMLTGTAVQTGLTSCRYLCRVHGMCRLTVPGSHVALTLPAAAGAKYDPRTELSVGSGF